MKSDKSALNTEVGGNHYKEFRIQPIEFIEGKQNTTSNC